MIVGPIKARSVCSHHLCLMLGKDWNSASAYPFATLASYLPWQNEHWRKNEPAEHRASARHLSFVRPRRRPKGCRDLASHCSARGVLPSSAGSLTPPTRAATRPPETPSTGSRL